MKKRRIIDAGSFNRKLAVRNKVQIADGFGGFSSEYVSDGPVWACITPEVTKLELSADQRKQYSTHRISLRFHVSVKPGSLLVSGARSFAVQTVRDVDEMRRYLECLAIEE